MLTQKTFYILPYYELDAIISRCMQYELNTSVVAANEMLNDHVYAFENVDGELDNYELNDIQHDIANVTISQFNVGTWLNYLVSIGKFNSGNYLITV